MNSDFNGLSTNFQVAAFIKNKVQQLSELYGYIMSIEDKEKILHELALKMGIKGGLRGLFFWEAKC